MLFLFALRHTQKSPILIYNETRRKYVFIRMDIDKLMLTIYVCTYQIRGCSSRSKFKVASNSQGKEKSKACTYQNIATHSTTSWFGWLVS